MRFESLAINNLRCLEQFEFRPAAGTNLVLGANGSGKTSVLEGFALASGGKSFQSNRSLDIIRSGSAGLSVRAGFRDERGLLSEVHVRKRGGETAITLDGQGVSAASPPQYHHWR